jgi:hypothetical protein
MRKRAKYWTWITRRTSRTTTSHRRNNRKSINSRMRVIYGIVSPRWWNYNFGMFWKCLWRVQKRRKQSAITKYILIRKINWIGKRTNSKWIYWTIWVAKEVGRGENLGINKSKLIYVRNNSKIAIAWKRY